MAGRIEYAPFMNKIMSAEDAAALIHPGANIGFSGFTGSGCAAAVPVALAERIKAAHAAGQEFKIGMFTGASTVPELDGVLAEADGVSFRTPYQSDPHMRNNINADKTLYSDIHLSHLAQQMMAGFHGRLDFAVVEGIGITSDGELVPSTSLGNNRAYLQQADKIILEINSWHSPELLGLSDIYYGPLAAMPPNRKPIPIIAAGDRIGQSTLQFDLSKVVAIVETNKPDRGSTYKALDEDSKAIAGHLLDWFANEVKHGRLPKNLLPLQSGVGNVANAVLAGLKAGPYEHLTSYTEVIQDGMIDLIDNGIVDVCSATSLSLSPELAVRFNEQAAEYRKKIVLRPQDVSNHPEVIRRLGVISCNGMIEADIYGNVNSTHVSGTRIMNGIGGSGDFTRNALVSSFVSPSTAKDGAISAIVPMVSHHDHTEHDVDIIITEQGLADLRGLAPRQRARVVINNCAHPAYRPQLLDYVERAEAAMKHHTPHLLGEALSFHQRLAQTGSMLK